MSKFYKSISDKFTQFPKGSVYKHTFTERTPNGDSGLETKDGAVMRIKSVLLNDERYFVGVSQSANQPEPSLPEKCNMHVYWWDGEYDGDCELPKGHLEPFHYDGISYFDDDNNNRDYEQENLEKLMQAHEEATVREAEYRGQTLAIETLQNFKSAARKAQGMLGGSPMIHADEIIRLANIGLRQLHPQAGEGEVK